MIVVRPYEYASRVTADSRSYLWKEQCASSSVQRHGGFAHHTPAMKLGFLTGNSADIEKAARLGFTGIELNVATFGNPANGPLDKDKIAHAKSLAEHHRIEITALAYYGIRAEPQITSSYEHVFDAAETLGVRVIASMAGFDWQRDWKGNVQFFADRFGPVAEIAEKRNLRVAFENWMSVHGRLPFRPVNMGGSPDTWDAMFAAVPSRALGIEFDPSHLYWQGIDH
ncbi:MAG TPA: sugar phosphate isomerase/epimerase family protein, partial [Ktedonobacteraceae bacterium]|nr:sugar phosphate isomerase/epimerase family protein [Ktedonobacteraceae bacterium]